MPCEASETYGHGLRSHRLTQNRFGSHRSCWTEQNLPLYDEALDELGIGLAASWTTDPIILQRRPTRLLASSRCGWTIYTFD
jgi:hypothetical protein